MSESDSFIDEVTDAVRQDKLFAAFRKWWWVGALIILAIVGGTAWNAWQKEQAAAEARGFGDQVMAAMNGDDTDAALAKITPDGAGRAAVLKILQGDQAVSAKKPQEAVKFYQEAAAEPGLPASITQLAQLKAVLAGGSSMDPTTRTQILARLAQPGAPYRPLAMEQQAIDKLASGDKAGAIATATQILQDAGLTPGLQQRATELIVALGGKVPQVPGAVSQPATQE